MRVNSGWVNGQSWALFCWWNWPLVLFYDSLLLFDQRTMNNVLCLIAPDCLRLNSTKYCNSKNSFRTCKFWTIYLDLCLSTSIELNSELKILAGKIIFLNLIPLFWNLYKLSCALKVKTITILFIGLPKYTFTLINIYAEINDPHRFWI